jgi:hypothetical protein
MAWCRRGESMFRASPRLGGRGSGSLHAALLIEGRRVIPVELADDLRLAEVGLTVEQQTRPPVTLRRRQKAGAG